jgi:hypothetical protein
MNKFLNSWKANQKINKLHNTHLIIIQALNNLKTIHINMNNKNPYNNFQLIKTQNKYKNHHKHRKSLFKNKFL